MCLTSIRHTHQNSIFNNQFFRWYFKIITNVFLIIKFQTPCLKIYIV